MFQTANLIRIGIASAVLAASVAANPARAQTTDPSATPGDPPLVVIEDRSLRERMRDRDLTLSEPLELQDATGNPIVTLPTDTTIGRERLETRFAAEDQPIRNRIDLRRVTLQETTTLTDRRTGEMIELPAGTILRVKLDQRFDADGNVVRDRIDVRAVQPDGTKIRFRDRAPEIEVVDIENEVDRPDAPDMDDSDRRRGGDGLRVESNRGSRVASSGRGGGDRVERPERGNSGSGRAERPERPERSGSSGRGGGNSGPG